MFKTIAVAVTILAAVALSVPAQAQLGCYTNYITNGNFAGSGNWTYGNYAYRETTIDDPCDIYYNYTMTAAALKNPYDSVSQTFTTGSSLASGWTMNFEVQTTSISGATAWDEVRVLVENLTTSQSEVFYVKGNQLTSTCQRFDFTLSNSYANSQVRITFNAQAYTSLDFYIDNVAFTGRYC